MQTSDQSSRKEQGPGEGEGGAQEEQVTLASGELMSVGRDQEQGVAGKAVLSATGQGEQSGEEEYEEEAVLKGLIYPPPPSFYLRQREAPTPRVQRAQPPAAAGSGAWGAGMSSVSSPYLQSSYPSVPPRLGQSPPGYVQASYGVYPQRQSYTWIWVLVSLIVALVLSACGLFAWLSYSMFGTAATSASDAASNGPLAINNYYQALQAQDYKQAYSYLSPAGSISGLTEEQFIKQAQQRDEEAGPIYTFQTGDPNIVVQGNQAVTGFTITVDLSRGKGEKYTAHLTLQKVGTQWKIANFDKI